MISPGFASLLLAGLGMGMVHALDPDHIVTLSSLGSRTDAAGATRRYALSWGAGHGGVLVLAALALLVLDLPLPATLPGWAERLVGVILLASGSSLALALWRNHQADRHPSPLRAKAPFLIGMVHGTAGSAALFGLLPIGLLSPMQGVVYVLVFSGGVLLGMMGFGLGFDSLARAVSRQLRTFDRPLRGSIAALAIGMGGYWLVSA